jgi:cAMP-dependent protein kinase regulator
VAGYDRSLYQTYLSQVPMFRSCSGEQLDRLAELGSVISAAAGEPIVREGEAGDAFYVLTSGNAAVERGTRHVGKLGAGDYFGELALFDDAPRNATVRAESQVSMVALERDAFAKALNDTPAIRDALLHGMAHRLHELDARA